VSAIIKEQSGSGEATTTGTASKPLSFSYKIDAQTNSTNQSDLAGQLGNKESATQAGCWAIGCGGLVALVGLGSWLAGVASSKYDAGQLGATLLLGLGGLAVLIFGITSARSDSSDYAARKSEVDRQNKRIDNAWYCAKCDVRFDDAGAF
jgi:hypothetical protein